MGRVVKPQDQVLLTVILAVHDEHLPSRCTMCTKYMSTRLRRRATSVQSKAIIS
jgi:hypothetical protein